MKNAEKPGQIPEFDNVEGLALALSYLEDPSNVACPRCGPDNVEVVGYARQLEGTLTPASPDDDYTVVLFCHGCRRAAALELNRAAA